jgi:hypothetical protein
MTDEERNRAVWEAAGRIHSGLAQMGFSPPFGHTSSELIDSAQMVTQILRCEHVTDPIERAVTHVLSWKFAVDASVLREPLLTALAAAAVPSEDLDRNEDP